MLLPPANYENLQEKWKKNLKDPRLLFLELFHLGLHSGKVWENRFFYLADLSRSLQQTALNYTHLFWVRNIEFCGCILLIGQWLNQCHEIVKNRVELGAILRESKAKLEMKNYNPPSFFVWRWGRLPGGMNENSHIWIGRCIVAMVTALDHVGQTSMFLPKNSLSRSKNKRVFFSYRW